MPYTPGDDTEDTGWMRISSSCLQAVRWKPTGRGKGTCYARYEKTWDVYEYHAVPRSVFDDMMAAGSHGSFFVHAIRNGGYSFKGPT